MTQGGSLAHGDDNVGGRSRRDDNMEKEGVASSTSGLELSCGKICMALRSGQGQIDEEADLTGIVKINKAANLNHDLRLVEKMMSSYRGLGLVTKKEEMN